MGLKLANERFKQWVARDPKLLNRCMGVILKWDYSNKSYRTALPTATAHTFCASRDGVRNSDSNPPIQRYFCAVYDYAGKEGLNNGYLNLKRRLGETMHFSVTIRLQFRKNAKH